MPRLDTFDIKVTTGESPLQGDLKFAINGFPLDFDNVRGGTGPHETFEATGAPGSFPHSLVLKGPEEGAWDIETMRITYHVHGEEPYTIRFGAVTVDHQSDLNLWVERPQPVLDV